MKTFFILAGLVAFSCAHLIPAAKKHPRIINGDDVKVGEIPYQVSLQNKMSDFHFCGGSIVNKKYVLTAAHCVIDKSADTIKVVAGTVNLLEPVSTYMVEKIIIHAEYDSLDSWRHDIALISIDGEFVMTSLLSHVPLQSENTEIPAESLAIVSGWGRLSEGGPSPMQLQKAEIYTVDQESCRKQYEKEFMDIFETHVCARDPVEQIGACNGDSGGPLTVNGNLYGIVSWSYGCAMSDWPTVYTKVPKYIDWIQENAV